MRVLVIEDDPDLVDLYRDYMGQIDPDSEVVSFASVEEFMQNFFVPDVLILDVNLPGMSGLSLLSELTVKYNVPTLVITGLEDAYIDRFVLRFSRTRLLRKPVFFSNFYRAFREVMETDTPRLYGSIKAFPIATLLQFLSSSEVPWLVEIPDKKDCFLLIIDRRVRFARCGELEGDKAAYHILSIDEGEFICHLNPSSIPSKFNMDRMPEELILNWIMGENIGEG